MSDPGTPRLNWDGVFDRAHRRLYARLFLLSAVGGLIALLLLGGGLSARGAVRWRLGPFGNKAVKEKPLAVKVDRKVAVRLRRAQSPSPVSPPLPHPSETPKARISRAPQLPPAVAIEEEEPPCSGSESVQEQYENECLPEPTSDGGSTGDGNGSGASEPSPTENGGTEAPPETEPDTIAAPEQTTSS